MPKKERARKRLTIRDVAEDAGVSVAAVSKVLREAYGVSDALKTKVQGSIDKLGYRPSTAARAMRGQTYTVGVLVVDISNPYLPDVISGVESVLGPAGYKLLFGVGGADMRLEATLIDTMIDNRLDGLILIAPGLAGEQVAQFARQIPLVLLGHHEPQAETFDTVNSNDFEGARMATFALIDAKYDHIVMLNLTSDGTDGIEVYNERERGFLSAVKETGRWDDTSISYLPARRRHLKEQMEGLIDGLRPSTGLFCWSDLDAIPLVDIAKSRGVRIPDDLGMIGYDNSPTSAMSLISLSSIDQQGRAQGVCAAELLLQRIGGRKTPEHHLLEPKLIRRGSIK